MTESLDKCLTGSNSDYLLSKEGIQDIVMLLPGGYVAAWKKGKGNDIYTSRKVTQDELDQIRKALDKMSFI